MIAMWASAVKSMWCESPEVFSLPTLTMNKCKMGEGLIQIESFHREEGVEPNAPETHSRC